ncbi:cell wall hydrolase [Williamsia muralis]|uniref:Cell wall hydrolase n=1 Tax=Williamsia marianensis TaxID=85044 RepID=A0A2G3PKJ6_WILMA|nr:N-acetylmuramoyl-L-alanine amidase [Williamsia marianensis]PHV66349.1 cell wall hydrolase [Williamsia marianensis]
MPTAANAEPAPPQGNTLAGKTVFLDPGHQGSAAGNDLNKPVPDGRGGTKPCQTTGATSPDGVPEHKVNWDITQLVKAGLESQGAKVVLSRQDDAGWGGCIDERANAANASNADLAVNIHADSTSPGTDAGKSGFHIIVPELPIPDAAVNEVQSGKGRKAAEQMRDAFKSAGFAPANYAGAQDGLQTRADIAAVNLTKVPDVFAELGNLSNPADAAALSGAEGQLKYAIAIVDGAIRYLLTGATAPAPATAPTTGTTPTTATASTTGTSPTTAAPSAAGTQPTTPAASPVAPAAPSTTTPPTTAPSTTAPSVTTPSTPARSTTTPSTGTPKATTPSTTPKTTTTTPSPGIGFPQLPLAGQQSTTPTTEQSEGIDLSGLQAILPLLGQLTQTDDPEAIEGLLSSEGSDAASQVLQAMLSVVYEMFGGKLPI